MRHVRGSDRGNGVGLFVQSEHGGHWNLVTTCDTDITGSSCNFDVGVALNNVQGVDLSPEDTIAFNSDGSINLVTATTDGSNGLTFDADPGAIVEIDTLLDGVPQPRFVFVVSDGELLDGVSSNPVAFAPNAP